MTYILWLGIGGILVIIGLAILTSSKKAQRDEQFCDRIFITLFFAIILTLAIFTLAGVVKVASLIKLRWGA